jgi:hypothetical protein
MFYRRPRRRRDLDDPTSVADVLHPGAVPLRVGGVFPDDGWTLEDVIMRAEEEWARSGPMHLDAGPGDE